MWTNPISFFHMWGSITVWPCSFGTNALLLWFMDSYMWCACVRWKHGFKYLGCEVFAKLAACLFGCKWCLILDFRLLFIICKSPSIRIDNMTISFISKLLEGLVMVSKWEIIHNFPKNKCCHFSTYLLFDAQGPYQTLRMDQIELYKLFGRAYSLMLNLWSY